MNKRLMEAAESIRKEVFLGGTIGSFEKDGRHQFIRLLRNGMNPDSKLLDIGCGCLRGGYWTMRFLDRGCYFGIEPNSKMLEAGIHSIAGLDLINQKRPSFDSNDQYDFSVFGQEYFDYFMACSIWTHAPKSDIRRMLDQFSKFGRRHSTMLASFIRTNDPKKDYQGSDWVGKSHQSDKAGLIQHRLESLQEIGEEFGVSLKHLQPNLLGEISWLKATFVE